MPEQNNKPDVQATDVEPSAVIEEIITLISKDWETIEAFRVRKKDYPYMDKWDTVLINIDGYPPAFYKITKTRTKRSKGIDYWDVSVKHEFDVMGYNGKDRRQEPSNSPSISPSASCSSSPSPAAGYGRDYYLRKP